MTSITLIFLAAAASVLAPVNQSAWLSPGDLKTSQVNATGITGFVLELAPDGGVRTCKIFAPSENFGADALLCEKLPERARFAAAELNDESEPPRRYVGWVKWYGRRLAFLPPLNDRRDVSGAPLAVPISNPFLWFSDVADPLPGGGVAKTRMIALVSSTGDVVGCIIGSSSGSVERDKTACDQLKTNGKFYPARNGVGAELPGQWTTTIAWR